MNRREILLFPAYVRWENSEDTFLTNIGYSLREYLTWEDVPDHIEETIFWWSDDTPYEGMEMDEAVLAKFYGQPTLVDLDKL